MPNNWIPATTYIDGGIVPLINNEVRLCSGGTTLRWALPINRRVYGFQISQFDDRVLITENELKRFVAQIENKARLGIKVSEGGSCD